MKPTVVSSYVRSNKREADELPEESNTMAYVIGGAAIIALALVYIQVTIIVGLVLGAAYGVKIVYLQPTSRNVTEAVTSPQNVSEPKPKRHYEHRLKVRNYQTGKVIRV
jgi:hypothetical protein